jgi:hypothetical protein
MAISLRAQAGDEGTGTYNIETLKIISSKTASDEQLLGALMTLGYVDERPNFWSSIANDKSYREKQRILCVFQLFARHVKPPCEISKLAELLDKPTWIHKEDIAKVTWIAGFVPLKSLPRHGKTIFRLSVLGSKEKPIYFMIDSEDMSESEFYSLLTGENPRDLNHTKIIEIGW